MLLFSFNNSDYHILLVIICVYYHMGSIEAHGSLSGLWNSMHEMRDQAGFGWSVEMIFT